MTGKMNFLNNLGFTPPYTIGLLNGTKATGVQMGTAFLSPQWNIRRVLFIPQLRYTLISLSQVSKKNKIFPIINDDVFILEDRISGTLIGVGEERDEIYYFRTILATFSCVGSTQILDSCVAYSVGTLI